MVHGRLMHRAFGWSQVVMSSNFVCSVCSCRTRLCNRRVCTVSCMTVGYLSSDVQDMGFFDESENLRVLVATGGNVNAAVERLLSGS
jgi:UBA/TS-N domain